MAIDRTRLLTPKAMAAVDSAAIACGIDGSGLMARAGAAVAAEVLNAWPGLRRAVILVGPGNNGGDGHVVAGLLSQWGVPCVRYGMAPRAGTDAHAAYCDAPGDILPLTACRPEAGDVVIDALFGAGLDRSVGGDVAELITRVADSGAPVLAVDLPSGLSGSTGRPTGPVFKAERTVTFAALKPGHLLLPGREICGETVLADIGVPARLIASDDPLWRNHPGLYQHCLPGPHAHTHKYSRGHLVVFSGPLISGGAARLAAIAGLRAGAGAVTLATPREAVAAQAAHLTAIMQRAIDEDADLAEWLADTRLSAFALGPGFADLEKARTFSTRLGASGRPVVLDADALTAFVGNAPALREAYGGQVRLAITPHEGEFARLFPDLATDAGLSKVDRARLAAREINAIVVYKGADTVIAAPDGRAAVNADAPPKLATAGSGDVLTGILGGLLAQSVPVFEAACAAVAQHVAAAMRVGEHMTAEDLSSAV